MQPTTRSARVQCGRCNQLKSTKFKLLVTLRKLNMPLSASWNLYSLLWQLMHKREHYERASSSLSSSSERPHHGLAWHGFGCKLGTMELKQNINAWRFYFNFYHQFFFAIMSLRYVLKSRNFQKLLANITVKILRTKHPDPDHKHWTWITLHWHCHYNKRSHFNKVESLHWRSEKGCGD